MWIVHERLSNSISAPFVPDKVQACYSARVPRFHLTHGFAKICIAWAGHRPTSGDSSSISMGLSALAQPLKLNLVRASHEEQLRNYGGHTVLIEPLASMAAVEHFLLPRVQRTAAEAAKEEAAKASRLAAEEVPSDLCKAELVMYFSFSKLSGLVSLIEDFSIRNDIYKEYD